MPADHVLGPQFYRMDDFREIVAARPRLTIAGGVAGRITRGAELVARKALEDEHLYGVNTGFGSLCETRIDGEEMETLQLNHLLSHACGVGDPVPEPIARLTLLVKLLTLRSGNTGVSLAPVLRLVDFWNAGLVPAIPKRGTVGASGDLAPLAHM